MTCTKGTAPEQLSPPTMTFNPSLQFPTLPPSSASFPHLHFRGTGVRSHLPCYSPASPGRRASVPPPCSGARLVPGIHVPAAERTHRPSTRQPTALTARQSPPRSLCVTTPRCRSELPCRATFSDQEPSTPTEASHSPHACPLAFGICSEGRRTPCPVTMPL